MLLTLLIILITGLNASYFLVNHSSIETFLILSLIFIIFAVINFNKKIISTILLYLSWLSLTLSYGYVTLNKNPMYYDFNLNEKEEVLLSGKVISSVDFKYGKMQCFIKLNKIFQNDETHKINDKVLMECSSEILGPRNLPYGSTIKFSAKLLKLNKKNKFDLFLLQKNIKGKAKVKKITEIYSPSKTNQYVSKMKSMIRRTFYKNDRLDFLSENIIFGLVFGEKQILPPKLKKIFINTNVYHIFAVSGLHFGVIAFFIFNFLRFFGVSKPSSNLLTIPLLFIFLIMINFPPSSVRAFIMIFFYLIAPIIGRQYKPLHILFLAAFIILLIYPKWYNDIGFILSFTAMFSLLTLGAETDKFFSNIFLNLQEQYKMDEELILKFKFYKTSILTVSYTTCAWIGTAPLVAYYFKIFSPISIISNLTAILFVPVIMKLILLTLVIGFFGAFIIKAFSSVIAILLHIFIYILIHLEKLPYSHITLTNINPLCIFTSYFLFITAYLFMKYKNENK